MQTIISKIPSDWNKIPNVSTRSELLAKRKKENQPDISFDLDGDGVVGGKDLFISKRFDLDGDGKLTKDEHAKAVAEQSNFEDQFIWGCDSSGINRSFRIVQKRGNVILNEEFTEVQNSYPSFPNRNKNKVKSRSELEEKRKQEIKAKGKYFEQKLNKDYKRQETDPYYTIENLPKHKAGLEYRENPKFRTKEEMLRIKKQQLLEDLNNSCNFSHKGQYERIMSREKVTGYSPAREMTSIHEKIKKQNMDHYSDTFGKRPIGLHGTELPKFNENLREYWKVNPGLKTAHCSAKKLTILNHDKNMEDEYMNKNKRIIIQKKKENFDKPNEIEFTGVAAEREYCRNGRWTDYHYNFIKKEVSDEVEKALNKSCTADSANKSRAVKTPRSLMAQRMQKKGSFSPVKDQFRSTGFTYSVCQT